MSHADRLNELLRLILFLTVKYNCIVLYHWISTHDNVLADPLSRDDEQTFLVRATSPCTDLLNGMPTPELAMQSCVGDGGGEISQT